MEYFWNAHMILVDLLMKLFNLVWEFLYFFRQFPGFLYFLLDVLALLL